MLTIKELQNEIKEAKKTIAQLEAELKAEKAILERREKALMDKINLDNCELIYNWNEGISFSDEDQEMDRVQLNAAMKMTAAFSPKIEEEQGYNKFKFSVKVGSVTQSYRIDLNKEHAEKEDLIIDALLDACIESIVFGKLEPRNCLSYILLRNEMGAKIDTLIEDFRRNNQ